MNLVRWARKEARRSGNPVGWPGITIDQLPYWFSQFGYQGLGYGPAMIQTIQQNRETISADFTGFINGAYKTNGVVFAVMLARMALFSEARFQWQRMRNGQPGQLFGTQDLQILEEPWPNAVTGDLLTRAINDHDMAGNFYCTRTFRLDRRPPGKLARLRPDWVTIVKGSTEPIQNDPTVPGVDLTNVWDPTAELIGYIYQPGGHGSGLKPRFYLPEEICHFATIPDPLATYRGMSWVQPILSEVMGDRAMTTHKTMYFEQGAAGRASSRVATPTGWTTMGEVKVGDRVIGVDGRPTEVLGVYPQGEKDVYRVTFTGGVSTDCCEDHLWQVQTYGQRTGGSTGRYLRGFQVRSLRSLLDEGVRYPSGPHKFTIPLTEPVQYDAGEPLPLDPYVVGALLGDGYLGSGHVELAAHVDDCEWMGNECWSRLPLVAKARLRLRDRHRLQTSSARVEFVRRPRTARGNWMLQTLRELGLRGVLGPDKFVPEPYMRASVEDRESLLQGLIDTDGHVSVGQSGAVRFSSISERLARQVQELVESLGGVASIKRRVRRDSNAKVQWAVYFSRLPDEIVPVRLPRKREQYKLSRRFVDRTRFLKSVEKVGRDQMICIRVAATDGLYLTDDFIVTHNTPNLVVSMDTGKMDRKTFREWVDLFEDEHQGAVNAYKTLYLGQGANAQVVGANLKDLDYTVTQGQGELRICAAGGIHPVIMGFSEGLKASSLNNFQNARRLTGEKTFRPLWRNLCGSMQTVVPPPPSSRLWYDASDISFLQEDASDRAAVQLTTATAIRLLVDSGYDPASVVDAMQNNDITLLEHTGLYSVQLQPPGTKVDPQVLFNQGGVPGAQPTSPSNGQPQNGQSQQPPRTLNPSENVMHFAQALLTARAQTGDTDQ